MSKTGCPNREELLAYLVGNVGDETSLQVARHVETCLTCQDTLAHLNDGQDSLLASLRSPVEADEFADESHLQAALARAEGLLDDAARPPPPVPRRRQSGGSWATTNCSNNRARAAWGPSTRRGTANWIAWWP
jgi:anti-sigma factor RsiW